jgi:branched-chain amino acid transport system permease protein
VITGYWIELLSGATISAIASLGLYVQMSTGQMNVAQAAFLGIGGFAAAVLTLKLGLPFVVALAVGATLAAVIGLLFATMVLRLSHWWYAIASLAFGEAMVSIASNLDYTGGILGLMGIPARTTFALLLSVVIVLILFFVGLERSRFTLGMKAIRADETAAMASGVSAQTIRVSAFALGTSIAGLAGGLHVHLLTVITPTDLGFHISLNYFVNVAVGGTRHFWGTLVASYVLFILPELLRFSATDRFILFGILLVLIMVFLPQGLSSRRLALGGWVGRPRGLR